jgi:hypothetical protein
MESEASIIAKKIQEYTEFEGEEISVRRPEPGFMSNLLMVSLMGAAVVLTQITLLLVKWAKSLES